MAGRRQILLVTQDQTTSAVALRVDEGSIGREDVYPICADSAAGWN